MKILLTALLLIGFYQSNAQDTLSSDEFYNVKYPLPAGIKAGDSAATDLFLSATAPKVFKDANRFITSPLKDSSLRMEAIYSALISAFYQQDYASAIRLIDEHRKVSFTKKFKSPTLGLLYAYAKAKLAAGNNAFDQAYATAFAEDMKKVDPDFTKDVANRLKANTSIEFADNFKKDVGSFITEALSSDSSISMYNIGFLMEMFVTNSIIKNNFTAIQRVLNQISPEEIISENVKIPMKDGVLLNGLVYRNKNEQGKVPVLVSLSPYPGGTEGLKGNIFAVNGYVYLYVDNRCRRESTGTFFPYEDDSHDYYTIIDWASKQPWSNGKVGTTGGSYLGFTQWQAIRKENRHPALKAINPMVSVGFGIDFPRDHNTFYTYILQWAEFVKGKELNSAQFENSNFWRQKEYALYKNHIPFAKFDSVCGVVNPFFTRWVQHPDFDSYWKNILPTPADYASLNIPVLTTTGYFDADQLGAMYYYNNLKKYNANLKHHMIIGPYNHGSAQWMPGAQQNGKTIEDGAQIALYKYVIQWFDWALKGKPLPAFYKDNVNYFNTDKNEWLGAKEVASIAKQTIKLYLDPVTTGSKYNAKTLSKILPVKPTSVTYQHDINSVMDSVLIFSPGKIKNAEDSIYAFNRLLVFETAPLEKDIQLGGNVSAKIYISLNVPDADLNISYKEVNAQGKEDAFAWDLIRTRYRNSDEKPELITPCTIVPIEFKHSYLNIKKIAKGTRIRIYIGVDNNVGTEKNYCFGGVVSNQVSTEKRMVEMKLYTGGKYASVINVPIQ